MEFGPTGHWSADVTAWGSYIEESSTEKVPLYVATCELCFSDPQCIGAFAFVWGWKWEKTGTWYGLFNEWPAVSENISSSTCPVCESEVLSALQKCWTGQEKATKAPSIHGIWLDGERLPRNTFVIDQTEVTLAVNASQLSGNDLTALWVVTEEIVSDAVGGAFEATNPLLDNLQPGAQCPNHEAYASLAFRIGHNALPGEQCYSLVSYAMEKDLEANPGRYPGASSTSTFSEVQMSLAQTQQGRCQFPCDLPIWCHTTQPGEACYDFIQWVLQNNNTQDAPEALHEKKSIKGVQLAVHESMPGPGHL
ncbi:unnamed protein product [Durusdinium trenchii]|uniref:Uncharacterized protein n=1 Tax=Durusdinium trenchii TaxID=1381693 RepID=A0ABP0IN44_9DINO